MAVADFRQAPCVLAKRRGNGGLRVGVDAASVDVQCAFAAVENAVVEFVTGGFVNKFNTVFVDHPQTAVACFWRYDFDGNCFVEIHRPLGNVEVVRAHVAESAAGIFTVTPPLREVLVHVDGTKNLVEAALRSRAKPHLPIDPIRLGFRGQIAADCRSPHPDLHLFDFADAAVADALDRLPKSAAVLGALLAADLKNDVVATGRLERLERGTHGYGQRLFAVDILFGIRRHDGRHRVPMIRCADNDRIHRLVVEDIPKIVVSLAAMFLTVTTSHPLDSLVQTHLGHLGDGRHPAVPLAKEEVEVARVHAAKADKAKVDPLAWFVSPSAG